MKLAKKYTHYVVRTDAPSEIIRCTSLDHAMARALSESNMAHYTSVPDLSVCDRSGTEVAKLHMGEWVM